MIDKNHKSAIFTAENILDFATKQSKIVCAILSKIPGNEGEYVTIGMVADITVAYEKCVEMGGDAIEIWIVTDNVGTVSERWEPKWFKDHFVETIENAGDDDDIHEYYLKTEKDPPDEDRDEDEEADTKTSAEKPHMFLDHPDKTVARSALACASSESAMLNYTMKAMLDAEQSIAEMLTSVSFATGHPIDIPDLVAALQHAVARMLFALTYSKGGVEPKHKESGFGHNLPYWTKSQIKKAKLNSDEFDDWLGDD